MGNASTPDVTESCRVPAGASPGWVGDRTVGRGRCRGGKFEKAAQAYFSIPAERTHRLLKPDQSITLGDWLAQNGHARAALIIYQRHLRDYPVGPKAADAHLGAGLVQLYALGQATAAYQHLVEVLDLDPSPETARLAREAVAADRGPAEVPGPRSLIDARRAAPTRLPGVICIIGLATFHPAASATRLTEPGMVLGGAGRPRTNTNL